MFFDRVTGTRAVIHLERGPVCAVKQFGISLGPALRLRASALGTALNATIVSLDVHGLIAFRAVEAFGHVKPP